MKLTSNSSKLRKIMNELINLFQTQKAKVLIRSKKLAVELALSLMLTYLDYLIKKPGVITMIQLHRRISCENNLTFVSHQVTLVKSIRQNLEGMGIEGDNFNIRF